MYRSVGVRINKDTGFLSIREPFTDISSLRVLVNSKEKHFKLINSDFYEDSCVQVYLNGRVKTLRFEGFIQTEIIKLEVSLETISETRIISKRSRPYGDPDRLYMVYIEDGIVKTATSEFHSGEKNTWIDGFVVGSGSSVNIAFDGHWQRYKERFGFVSHDKPYLFWVSSGDLYVQRWKDSANKRLLSQNVTKVSSIRGWKNNTFLTHDQGIICAYIKTDGKVYYRNYCTQADGSVVWENEREVTDFIGTARSVNLFITNDYRTGFVIEDSSNKTHILLTSRNWAGMAIAPENITASPVRVGVDFIPLEYFEAKETDNITVSPVSNVVTELKYALTDNKFTNIYNQPVLVDDIEDWGKVLIFETKYELNNLNKDDFEIVDSFDRLYSPDMVEEIGDKLYKLSFLEFNNFNNVNDVGTLKFKGLYATNGIDLVYEPFEKVFYPENLIPTEMPLPEVELIWNE